MRPQTALSAATSLPPSNCQSTKCPRSPSPPIPGALPFLHRKHRQRPAGLGWQHIAESHRALQPAPAYITDVASLSEDVCSAPVIDSVQHKAGVFTIHGSLETQLSSAAVLDVLTDYDSLSRVYSTIECSRMAQKGGRKEVFQTCRWEFLVFSGTFDTHLTVEEDRPAGRVVFNMVSSAFMRSFQGLWQVQELPSRGCRVEHRLSVQPVVAPPDAFSGYTQKIFERQVEQLLKDLGQELCRVQGR